MPLSVKQVKNLIISYLVQFSGALHPSDLKLALSPPIPNDSVLTVKAAGISVQSSKRSPPPSEYLPASHAWHSWSPPTFRYWPASQVNSETKHTMLQARRFWTIHSLPKETRTCSNHFMLESWARDTRSLKTTISSQGNWISVCVCVKITGTACNHVYAWVHG